MKKSNSSKKNPRVNFLANVFLIIGLIGAIFCGYLMFERYNPQNLSFDLNYNPAQVVVAQSVPLPTILSIESAGIFLQVYPAQIENNQWEVTTKGVSYLANSSLPGESGNSIIYGHNWPNLLGNLKKVKPGDKITVNFSDNSSKDFLVEYIAEFKPDQTSILRNSADARLTIYTCSGFLDSKRIVVVAKPLV